MHKLVHTLYVCTYKLVRTRCAATHALVKGLVRTTCVLAYAQLHSCRAAEQSNLGARSCLAKQSSSAALFLKYHEKGHGGVCEECHGQHTALPSRDLVP